MKTTIRVNKHAVSLIFQLTFKNCLYEKIHFQQEFFNYVFFNKDEPFSSNTKKKIVQGSTTIQVASTNQSRLVIIYNTAMDVVVVIG